MTIVSLVVNYSGGFFYVTLYNYPKKLTIE